MNSTELRNSVTKLNSTNYQLWKFKSEMILAKDDLWDLVENNVPQNPDTNWNKRNRKAMALIALLVEDDQLINIRKYKTAFEMWKALRDLHERPSLNTRLYLLRKIYKKRLGVNENMETHINTILEIAEQMRGIGEIIQDNHLAALLLCSVPESYDNLITALEARPESELTLDYVKTKLIDEDKRRKETKNEYNMRSEAALKTRYLERPRRDTRSCYHCGKTGHIKKDCRIFKREQRPNFQTKPRANLTDRTNGEYKNDNLEKCDINNEHICFSIKGNKHIDGWYIDSGASDHMTPNKDFFSELTMHDDHEIKMVRVADGHSVKIMGSGWGYLKPESPSQNVKLLKLENVLYIPEMEENLLSVKRLANKGYTITFKGTTCKIIKDDKTIATDDDDSQLYMLKYSHRALSTKVIEHDKCIHHWHRVMGHRDPKAIEKMEREKMSTDLMIKPCKKLIQCDICIECKMTNLPYPKQAQNRANKPYILLHCDLCGPMRTPSIGGNLYILTITDDYSRFTETFPLKNKHEASGIIISYINKWNNIFGYKPHKFRTDGGGEFINKELNEFFTHEGIQRQITVPNSPEQNGVAERKNRHLLEMTRCMLKDSKLDNCYWAEAVITATYLQNRLPHRSCVSTPHELWYSQKPSITHLRTFGSKVYIRQPNEKLSKLDDRTKTGIFLGYSENRKGYRVRLDDSGRITYSRNLHFNIGQAETDYNTEKNPEATIILDNSQEIKTEPDLMTTELPRRSGRTNKGKPPNRLSLKASTIQIKEPDDWNDILKMRGPEKQAWIEAINSEIKAFQKNKAWDLVPLPPGKNLIGSKWTFKIKYNSEGQIAQYKARLVAKGYSQTEGIDYQETFAPVAKYSTIRSVLTIASSKNMHTKHMDVKSAFLNGDINEELYMQQPEGQVKKNENHLVCRLNKSIYGLRQAANTWNSKINSIFIREGFIRGVADPCIYTYKKDDTLTYILLYVDDLLICSTSPEHILEISKILEDTFDMKDLGEISYYLGIEISKAKNGKYMLRQSNKIATLAGKFGLSDCKPTSTPMEIDYPSSGDEPKFFTNNELYRQAIGALLHIATVTRPDISIAVGLLGRKVSKPTQKDWSSIKRVIRYLKSTQDEALSLGKCNNIILNGYTDSDWAGDQTDRKSTSGYAFFLDNSLISWCSKKQNCVALSSTEAEYVAASNASQELLWIKQLLKDLNFEQTEPIQLCEDNQSCIKLCESEKFHGRTKHIDVKHHMLKQLKNEKAINLVYCPTEDMLADILTKPLNKSKFIKLKTGLGMVTPTD